MKALALFGVMVVAKLLAVAGRELPLSWWTPLALFWQDALVALAFGAVELCVRKRAWVSWSLFGAVVAYAAMNVPLTRILSSPLTWQMSRAAHSALGDSIRYYVTPGNVLLIATVMLAGVLSALAAKRFAPRSIRVGLIAITVAALIGPFAAGRTDCAGLHRNCVVALVESALPRVRATESAGAMLNWRNTSLDSRAAQDLSQGRGTAAGRNVVLIALESTGASYLKCYGAMEDPTPNLTRLAGTSMLFENACSVYPESIKGLFSVLCSRYPAFDTRAEDCARAPTPSLAQVLAQAGYRTALFHSGRFIYLGMNAVVQQRGFDVLQDAGAISGNFNSSFGVDEPATVKQMLAWIDGLPHGQRFFLHYLPIAGHHPYATPERGPFADHAEIGQYRNALHFGDAALGQLVEGLRRRGLDTNTLFVIYGDHGEAFGQHEGNFGHTLFLFEENIHVPLLIAMPGQWHEQTRVRKVASLIDVAPTILDLMDLSVPADYQGSSLLEGRERAALFYTDYSLSLVGLRDGNWKFIHELGSGQSKLFDLGSDPAERHNLALHHPARVGVWRRHLARWAAAQKAAMLNRQALPVQLSSSSSTIQ